MSGDGGYGAILLALRSLDERVKKLEMRSRQSLPSRPDPPYVDSRGRVLWHEGAPMRIALADILDKNAGIAEMIPKDANDFIAKHLQRKTGIRVTSAMVKNAARNHELVLPAARTAVPAARSGKKAVARTVVPAARSEKKPGGYQGAPYDDEENDDDVDVDDDDDGEGELGTEHLLGGGDQGEYDEAVPAARSRKKEKKKMVMRAVAEIKKKQRQMMKKKRHMMK